MKPHNMAMPLIQKLKERGEKFVPNSLTNTNGMRDRILKTNKAIYYLKYQEQLKLIDPWDFHTFIKFDPSDYQVCTEWSDAYVVGDTHYLIIGYDKEIFDSLNVSLSDRDGKIELTETKVCTHYEPLVRRDAE